MAAEFGVSRERVRQIEVSAFEKVQKAVKNRVAATESPALLAGALASNPFPWWEKLPMEVSRSGTFYGNRKMTREGRRSPGAKSIVTCGASPRSTIHARHFASSIGRLSRALQMESYPKFHNELGVPIVRIGCREFKCIGDKPPQDHPVWSKN